MKQFLKKFGLWIAIGIVLIASIIITIIAFNQSGIEGKEDEDVYISVKFNVLDEHVEMKLIGNKESDINFCYVLNNEEKNEIISIKEIANEDKTDYQGEYKFSRLEKLYNVNNLKLTFEEEVLFEKEYISIPSLISDNIENPDNNNPQELKGKLISDTNETLQIAFFENSSLIQNYEYVINCDNAELDSNLINFVNGSLFISKKGLNVGVHSLSITVQNGIDTGVFNCEFDVKDSLYINNVQTAIPDFYYKGVDSVFFDVYINGNENLCKQFEINNSIYEYLSVEYDVDKDSMKYTIEVNIDSNLEEPTINLTKIIHNYGEYTTNISKKVNLENAVFEAKIEYEKDTYFEGDYKNVMLTIGNPNNLFIESVKFNNTNYDCNSDETEINVPVSILATKNKDIINSIKYNVYGKSFETEILEENSSTILTKISSYQYNDYVELGEALMLNIIFDKDISDASIKFSGMMNLSQEFVSDNIPYAVENNILKIDFSEFITKPTKYTIFMSGINIGYGNNSYTVMENEVIEIYYADVVYNLYNFDYNEEDYNLYFNADVFGDTKVTKLTYRLYDENDNLLRDESNPSEVHCLEQNGINYYYMNAMPSNVKYIEVIAIDCTHNGENTQVTQWLLSETKITIN